MLNCRHDDLAVMVCPAAQGVLQPMRGVRVPS
jgi:hypothetical protein